MTFFPRTSEYYTDPVYLDHSWSSESLDFSPVYRLLILVASFTLLICILCLADFYFFYIHRLYLLFGPFQRITFREIF